MSTKPGETTRFFASIMFFADSLILPIFLMIPSLIPISDKNEGFPVPSMICPFLINKSYSIISLFEPSIC